MLDPHPELGQMTQSTVHLDGPGGAFMAVHIGPLHPPLPENRERAFLEVCDHGEAWSTGTRAERSSAS
jgi:hypothetical protein